MSDDYFEIDFLDVDAKESGDAIPLRYKIGDVTRIHVTDGGFQKTEDKIVKHIKDYYGNPATIDAVIVSHPHDDHTGGLHKVLAEFEVSELWMLRPWDYVDELIDRFARFTNRENLKKRLKEVYPNIAALEETAEEEEIPIYEPFQGAKIGDFTVLAPTKDRYIDLIVESENTPQAAKRSLTRSVSLVKSDWGDEEFPDKDTSEENNMSVIQYANLCNQKILLTADAGREALAEAANFAPTIGLYLPGIDRFQVPHHGSRRNVCTEILNLWLSNILPESDRPEEGTGSFTTIISASEEDEDHPKNVVVRACIHRGAKVVSTQGNNLRTGCNAPKREGWTAATPLEYPPDQEKD